MQELANELTDMDLGLEPMPDASLLTVATLIYCSLAVFGVFLRQQDEELEDSTKPQPGPRQDGTKPSSASDPAAGASRAATGDAASTSGRQQDAGAGAGSGASLAAAQKYCQQLSRESRLRVLCSNAAGHVTTSVRDSKYLLEQIMPLRLRDICNGTAPPPTTAFSTSSGSAIAAPGGLPPAPVDQDLTHGRNESALRSWLASLVDAQVDAKQRTTGLSRETAARVVLNNQDATLRHLCTIVAQETAMLGVLHLTATLQADPAFNPHVASAGGAAGGSAAAH